MANLRIIYDNAADRATITASTTAGGLTVANLLTDIKGEFHRSTGTSVTYALVWPTVEAVSAVALPALNITGMGTVAVRAYDAPAGGNLRFDSGPLYACPGQPLGAWDWSQPLGANAFAAAVWDWPTPANGNTFAYGGAARTAVWFDDLYAVRRVEIDLVDPVNPAGYIDCARVIAGAYWSPQYNPPYGANSGPEDGSTSSRNEAGDLLTDRFAIADAMKLDLQYMPPQDRARMRQIMSSNGTARPLFLSLIPDGDDPLLTQENMIYGKRKNSGMSFDFCNASSTNLTIEGW